MSSADDTRLTDRQLEVLGHLQALEASGEVMPGVEALARALNLRSRGSLHKHLAALVAAGLVEPMQRRRRGIHLTDAGRQPLAQTLAAPTEAAARTRLPVLGEIAAGRPVEPCLAPDGRDTLDLPASLVAHGGDFVVRVNGDSMCDAGILDGDWAVIDSQRSPRSGDVVVALVDGSEVTLKRLEAVAQRCVLHPANSSFESLALTWDRVQIQGVLVAQLRIYA